MNSNARAILVNQDVAPGKNFQKLDPEPFVPAPSFLNEKSRQWNLFDSTSTEAFKESHSSPVSHIHTVGEMMCVSVGGKVNLYKLSETNRSDVTPLRALTRFEANAFSGRLRHDGKLVCAGSDSGEVRVFDSTTRSMMRTFVGHGTATKCVRWTANGQNVVSGSNDKTCRLWDLSEEKEVVKFANGVFQDHVRSLCVLDENLVAAGSYDHSLQVLDYRTGQACFKSDLGSPVEDVQYQSENGSFQLFSASTNVVSLWDVRKPESVLVQVQPHQKTVTSLVCSSPNVLLSASLDGSIKVLDRNTLKTLHGLFLTKNALLSLAVSDNGWRVCLGASNGELLVCTKRTASPQSEPEENLAFRSKMRVGSQKYFVRGPETKPNELAVGAIVDAKPAKKKLQMYETHLKSFSHRQALDSALESKQPVAVVTVLEELSQRGPDALLAAVSGRDEISLEPLVAFLARYVTNPMYCSVLVSVCDTVLQCYSATLGESISVDAHFTKMRASVSKEVEVQKKVLSTLGSIEMLLSN
ncbi:hypothetical protein BASA81_001057 [Batrachochytrium salamandrivorans]|nr:hypothetical protein BASA81_001057 [Batrachochytrium salamandrivorans]